MEDNTMGLSVIVGSHMDDLTELAPYQRMPLVYVAKALFPGKNIIKNPLGGPIWIKKKFRAESFRYLFFKNRRSI